MPGVEESIFTCRRWRCKIPHKKDERYKHKDLIMIVYFDCFSGISGDMTLGALIDLGVPVAWLKDRIESLPLAGFDLTASSEVKNGITGIKAHVHTDAHVHSRGWAEIRSLIQGSPLPKPVVARSMNIFERIAEAESGIHGCSRDEVHFHEVGGIDAIVDIVGTALCLEYLEINRVYASKIPLGSGFVQCEHGILPVPAPATLAILKDIPVYGTDVAGEIVTPTGAAIVAELAEAYGPIPGMRIDHIGYGAGAKTFKDRPNLLRILKGKPEDASSCMETDHIVMVETCIDDMNSELFGFLMDRLFEDGALDAYWIPVQMKKSRPGTMIQVLCQEHLRDTIVRRILSETTSTGVRHYRVSRSKLPREIIHVESSYGSVRVKQITDLTGEVRRIPEYDVCKQIALDRDIPLRIVYDTILREVNEAKGTV